MNCGRLAPSLVYTVADLLRLSLYC
jgi:hypothetical protein